MGRDESYKSDTYGRKEKASKSRGLHLNALGLMSLPFDLKVSFDNKNTNSSGSSKGSTGSTVININHRPTKGGGVKSTTIRVDTGQKIGVHITYPNIIGKTKPK